MRIVTWNWQTLAWQFTCAKDNGIRYWVAPPPRLTKWGLISYLRGDPRIILQRQLIIGATLRWSPGDILTDKCGTPAFMSLGAKPEQQPEFFRGSNWTMMEYLVTGCWDGFWRSTVEQWAVHFLKVECSKIDGVISCGFILTRQKGWVRHKCMNYRDFWVTPMSNLDAEMIRWFNLHWVPNSTPQGSTQSYTWWKSDWFFGKPSVLNKTRKKKKPYWD